MNETLEQVLNAMKFVPGQFWLTPPNNKSWYQKTFLRPRRRKG